MPDVEPRFFQRNDSFPTAIPRLVPSKAAIGNSYFAAAMTGWNAPISKPSRPQLGTGRFDPKPPFASIDSNAGPCPS